MKSFLAKLAIGAHCAMPAALASAQDASPIDELRGFLEASHRQAEQSHRFTLEALARVDSLLRAEQSTRVLSEGRAETAALLALEGLPARIGSAKPWSVEASTALQAALASVRQTREWQDHDFELWTFAFSSDGHYFASAGDDGNIALRDLKNGSGPHYFAEQDYGIVDLDFSPDGQSIATSNRNGDVYLWQIGASEPPQRIGDDDLDLQRARFSPDGHYLATGDISGVIRIFAIDGEGEPVFLRGHSDKVTAIVYFDDGERLASSSQDGTVRIWSLDGTQSPEVLLGHEDWVNDLAVSPDGRWLASAGGDYTVRVWDLTDTSKFMTFRGHESWVNDVAFSRDGSRLASTGGNGQVLLWSAADAIDLDRFQGHDEIGMAVGFDPVSDTLVSAGIDGTVRFWEEQEAPAHLYDVPTRPTPVVLERHEGWAGTVDVSPDGAWIASTGEDDTLRLWPLRTGGSPRFWGGIDEPVTKFAFSNDGREILGWNFEGLFRIWSLESGEELRRQQSSYAGEPTLGIRAAALVDGKIIMAEAFSDATVMVWQIGNFDDAIELQATDPPSYIMSFSSDGGTLLAGEGGEGVMRWQIGDSIQPERAKIPGVATERIPLTAGGEWFTIIDWDDRLQVWRADDLVNVFAIDGDFQFPAVAATSASGSYVAAVDNDDEIHVWRVRGTSKPMRLVGLSGREINALAFSPSEDLLAAAADDGSILTWRIPPFGGDLVALARSALPRELNPDERERFFLPGTD